MQLRREVVLFNEANAAGLNSLIWVMTMATMETLFSPLDVNGRQSTKTPGNTPEPKKTVTRLKI